MGVKIIEKDIVPVCPYCEKELYEIIEVKRGYFKMSYVYCCPHCRKLLSIGVHV